MFQTVGAGGFYLANNQWRNAGSTNISPSLAQELRQSTTYAPVVLTGLLTSTMQLNPQALRDTDLPDLGYHYPPIDYAVCTLTPTNHASLTLNPGVTIASFGNHGLRLENHGSLAAHGTPTTPVRLFRYHVVQEQPLDWGNTTCEPTILTGPAHDTPGGNAPPAATLRFVQFSGLGCWGNHIYTDNGWFLLKLLHLRDCTFWNGKARFSGNTGSLIGLTNNLFARTAVKCHGWPQLSAYNNLFWGGSNRLERFSSAASWTFRDNAFDSTSLTNAGASVINSHNAYIGAAQCAIGGSSGADLLLNAFAYTNSSLGGFYHHSTSLLNRGSRNATAAGLYHYTVQADQRKESASTVDIGFHYPATDINRCPLDYEGDGLADYFEDRNGNGTTDPDETNWQSSQNGTSGVPGLQVFSPLE